MKRVRLHDKTFRLFIGAEVIDREIERIAGEINRDLAGERPLFVSILNGAFMFTSDLLKLITLEGTEVAFMRIASYEGLSSSGQVKELIGLTEEIAGRTVVVVEDIVDTGNSLLHLRKVLEQHSPGQIKVAALFYKPDALLHKLTIDYPGISLKNEFVVGRGLDYDGYGRNLPDLYILDENTNN